MSEDLTEDQVLKLKKVFCEYDQNADGMITKKVTEFKKLQY